MLELLSWSLFGLFLGAIPFSYLMGKLLVKKDIRTVGDGNPGGTNALKAGGLRAGVPAILLDIGKGFLPVFLAERFGLRDWSLIPVALSPVIGHAFSPFLRFRGGKALGATGGAWLGLIGWLAFPAYAALAVPMAILQSEDGWAACAGMASLLAYTILFGEPWLVTMAALNTAIIFWTHRLELVHKPLLREWVTNLFDRRHV